MDCWGNPLRKLLLLLLLPKSLECMGKKFVLLNKGVIIFGFLLKLLMDIAVIVGGLAHFLTKRIQCAHSLTKKVFLSATTLIVFLLHPCGAWITGDK